MSVLRLKSPRELILGQSSRGTEKVQKQEARIYQVCNLDISISRYSCKIVRKAK